MELSASFLSTNELLSREAETRPGEEPFAYCAYEAISAFDLNRRACSIANALITSGIKKGQSVAIICHNSLDYLPVEFGILKAGAVVVPINCLLKERELAYLLENSDAKFAFVHQNHLQEFRKANRNLPYCVIGSAGQNSLSELIRNSVEEDPGVQVGYKDSAFILYTSGTTGQPKGVVYEQYAILPPNKETYVQLMHESYGLSKSDTTYLPFALYHVSDRCTSSARCATGARSR